MIVEQDSVQEREPVSVRPRSRLIRTPEDAEQVAAEWLRYFGFNDARVTNRGADGGVDVEGVGVVAQVKAEFKPTGRPVIQQIFGIAAYEKAAAAVFSLNGYTAEAFEWASDARVALYQFDLQGEPQPLNNAARALASNPFEKQLADLELMMHREATVFEQTRVASSPTGEFKPEVVRRWLRIWQTAQKSARGAFAGTEDCESVELPPKLKSIRPYLCLLLFDETLGEIPEEVDDTDLIALFERRVEFGPARLLRGRRNRRG